MSGLKMSGEDVLYLLETLSQFEPEDIDQNDFDVAVNDDQFASMGIVRTAELGADLVEKLMAENKRLRDAIHKACSETCNVAVCGTIMMSADLFNGLVDAHNGCEETKERED